MHYTHQSVFEIAKNTGIRPSSVALSYELIRATHSEENMPVCLHQLFTGQMHFLSPNQQLTKTYSGDGSINCHYRFDENCKKVFSGSVAT